MTLEDAIQGAVERLRHNGYGKTTVTTKDGIVDRDDNEDGRLDDNPDTGTGSAPGTMVVEIRDDEGTHLIDVAEDAFEGITTVDAAFPILLDAAKSWDLRDVDEPK